MDLIGWGDIIIASLTIHQKVMKDPRYLFFINIFDTRGPYAEKFAPEYSNAGFNWSILEQWLKSHLVEGSLFKKAPSAFFKFPTPIFSSLKKILESIENHQVTHLLTLWTHWNFPKKPGLHGIGLGIYKDLSNNYHVIYLNKGERSTPLTTLEWYYVPKDHREIVTELIEAADTDSQEAIESVIYKLSLLKGTLLIHTVQPKDQKRGSCAVSNSIKSIARSEALLSSINGVDLERFLQKDAPNAISLDTDKQLNLLKLFKNKIYENKWSGAYEFSELFELTKDTQVKTSLGIILYQAFYNLFQKTRYNLSSDDKRSKDELLQSKLSIEINCIKKYFDRCIQSHFYQSAYILLMHLSTHAQLRVDKKELFSYCVETLLALPDKIHFQAELIDLIIQDLITNINRGNREAACTQLILLEKLEKQTHHSLLDEILRAVKKGTIDSLQLKISTPIHCVSFLQFAICYAIQKEQFSDIDSLSKVLASHDDNQAENFSKLAIAISSERLSVVNHLFQKGEADLDINSSLALAAQAGSLEIYKYLFTYKYSMYQSANKEVVIDFKASPNNLHLVEYCLKLHPDLIPDDVMMDWMKVASSSNRLELLERILSIQHVDNDDLFKNAAIPAVTGGSLKILHYLFHNNLITINQRHPELKATLLHYAPFSDNHAIFEFLCQQNPDHFVKTVDNKGGYYPFQVAVSQFRFKIIDYYLKNHFNELTADALFFCLKVSVILGNIEVTEMLMRLHQFSQVEIQEVFSYALFAGNLHLAKYFKNSGADINIQSDEDTYLDLAVRPGGNRRILDFLYQNHFDARAKTKATGDYSDCYYNMSIMNYLFEDAIKRCYSQYHKSWGETKDISYRLLDEFEQIIHSKKPLELLSRCNEWMRSLSGNVTKAEVLYRHPVIKKILEPLMSEFLEANALKHIKTFP